MVTETARHAGHADILREQLDGRIGMGPGAGDPQGFGDQHWSEHLSRVEAAALAAAQRRGPTAR